MNNPGRRFHKACGVLLAATLGLAACANQTGDWKAPAAESAAREDTRSANPQSEKWELDCKKFVGNDRERGMPRQPLDWMVTLPVCTVAGAALVAVGGTVIVTTIAGGVIMLPFKIIETAVKQSPASDVQTQADGETN